MTSPMDDWLQVKSEKVCRSFNDIDAGGRVIVSATYCVSYVNPAVAAFVIRDEWTNFYKFPVKDSRLVVVSCNSGRQFPRNSTRRSLLVQ